MIKQVMKGKSTKYVNVGITASLPEVAVIHKQKKNSRINETFQKVYLSILKLGQVANYPLAKCPLAKYP